MNSVGHFVSAIGTRKGQLKESIDFKKLSAYVNANEPVDVRFTLKFCEYT